MSRVLITGAGGFLGQAVVQAAQEAGIETIALRRAQVDLGDPGAVAALAPHLEGTSTIIHAAASFAGDAQTHARDTLAATDHLVQALEAAGAMARLVLVSSLSVYDVAAMVDHATLDEAAPLVRDASQRDAYAAAKAVQETIVQRYSGSKQVIRPGAIFGPHRLWSAQLGFVKAGRVICPGGDARMPTIEVGRAARAIVRAATAGQGGETINLIDPEPVTQRDWISALGLPILPVPRALVLAGGAALGRGAAWRARFRPLRYDTTRAETVLDPATARPFSELIKAAKRAEKDMS